MTRQTHHGTCILVGRKAVFLRGPAGAGKSRLALRLLQSSPASPDRPQTFCRLVGDDRIHLQRFGGRLVARAPANLAGLLELRGVGILCVAYETQAQIGLVVDLLTPAQLADKSPRLPEDGDPTVTLEGVRLPCLRLAQNDPAAITAIYTAMIRAGNRASNNVENLWQGLAETTELVLSMRR